MDLPKGLPAWLALLERRHPKSIQLGLERVGRVGAALGLRVSFPVISVAGTNGKGSVCAFLDAMLGEAGYKVGLYTSPHLLRFNERIRIAGHEVEDAEIVEALNVVEQGRGETALTYFEHTTLAAMMLFSQARVEAAVLEVGLGGRLDAVNLFDADCAVVTPVDIDHIDYLGPDREAIGREKSGIFRTGRPAVCIDPDPPASVLAMAERLNVPLRRIGHDILIEREQGQWLCRVGDAVYPDLPNPAMVGDYQFANAAAAISALDCMKARLPVPLTALRRGLAQAVIPGRFQVVGQAPLRIIDVAHNPHAASALARNLADIPRTGRCFAVLAMLADKDVAGVIAPLLNRIDVWLLAGLPGSRGQSAEMLAAHFDPKQAHVEIYPDVAEAWRTACQQAGPADTILVFGSFLTVAETLALISGKRNG